MTIGTTVSRAIQYDKNKQTNKYNNSWIELAAAAVAVGSQ